jgi:DNA-binding NarL/FixJ family response regulator
MDWMLPMSAITVVVADRQRARRAACLRLLEPVEGIRVVGKVGNTLGAVAATRLKPRILLLDLALAAGEGPSLLRLIRRQSPRTRIILLTEGHNEAPILDALARGAPGYLEKKFLSVSLTKAVRLVAAGEAWVPRKMVSKVVARLRNAEARRCGSRRSR